MYKNRKRIGSASFETSQHHHYITVTMVGREQSTIVTGFTKTVPIGTRNEIQFIADY